MIGSYLGVVMRRRAGASGFFASGINHFWSQAAFNAYTAGAKTLVTAATMVALGYTTSGGANGTVENAAGNIVTQAAPRISFVGGVQDQLLMEEARTNTLTNNTLVGLAAGSPGTMAAGWADGANSGGTVARQSIATGTVKGQPYADLRYAGTTAGAGNLFIVMDTGLTGAALTGQAWTASAHMSVAGGSLTNIAAVSLNIDEFTSGGAYITTQIGGNITLTGTLTRFQSTLTLAGGGTTAFAKPVISVSYTGAVAIDITIRVWLPQMEQGVGASTPILTANAGTVTRSADVCTRSTLGGYNAAGMTMLAEWVPIISTGTQRLISSSAVASPGLQVFSGTPLAGLETIFTIGAGAQVVGSVQRMAYRAQQSNHSVSLKGAAVQTSANATALTGSPGTYGVGCTPAGALQANAGIRRIAIGATAANDAQVVSAANGTL